MPFRKRQETVRPYQTMLRTTCGNCPTGCGLKIFLDHGRVADILGDEEHPANKGSICPKGLLTAWRLNAPGRLTGAMIRPSLSEPFRAVAWDEAVSFIASRLNGVLAATGKGSVALHAGETDPFDAQAAAALFAQALDAPLAPARFQSGPFGELGAIKAMFGMGAANLMTNTPPGLVPQPVHRALRLRPGRHGPHRPGAGPGRQGPGGHPAGHRGRQHRDLLQGRPGR